MITTDTNDLVKKVSAAIEKVYIEESRATADSPMGKMLRSMRICLSPTGPFSEEQLEGKKPLYSCLITGNGTPVEMRAWYHPTQNEINIDYLD